MLQLVVLAPFSQGPLRKSSAAELTDPVSNLHSPLSPRLSLPGAMFSSTHSPSSLVLLGLFSKESYFPRSHGILGSVSQDLCYPGHHFLVAEFSQECYAPRRGFLGVPRSQELSPRSVGALLMKGTFQKFTHLG